MRTERGAILLSEQHRRDCTSVFASEFSNGGRHCLMLPIPRLRSVMHQTSLNTCNEDCDTDMIVGPTESLVLYDFAIFLLSPPAIHCHLGVCTLLGGRRKEGSGEEVFPLSFLSTHLNRRRAIPLAVNYTTTPRPYHQVVCREDVYPSKTDLSVDTVTHCPVAHAGSVNHPVSECTKEG